MKALEKLFYMRGVNINLTGNGLIRSYETWKGDRYFQENSENSKLVPEELKEWSHTGASKKYHTSNYRRSSFFYGLLWL